MEVVASLSQGRTVAAQCGMFTYKSVPVIFEPPFISAQRKITFYLTVVTRSLSTQLTLPTSSMSTQLTIG